MRREVGLADVELAPLAGAHTLVGVGDCGGLVEALAGGVACEGVQRHVVARHARVDVAEELAALRNGYATLQDD
jgi:monomeric isocitrate dehydrogenase